MKIKSILHTLAMAMTVLVGLASCLGEKDEVVTDEYCYISNVTLGAMKREMHTTTAAGQDSIYLVSFSGSVFPMTIDQKNLLIQNLDSLPYGARVDALPVKVGFQGVLVYKQADDEDWHTFSDKDSINFTKPVEFKVYSSSSLSERKYTVKVNVHQVDGDAFHWNRMKTDNALAELKERSLVAADDKLVMLARKADGSIVCATRTTQTMGDWAVAATTGTEGAELTTLQRIIGGTMLMSNAKGAILQSQNGLDWTELVPAAEGRRLLGASLNHIYALTNGVLQCTGDGGLTWTDNALDDDSSLLPQSNLSLSFLHQDNGYDRLVLVGNSNAETDKKAAVWSKAWRASADEPTAKWMYYPHTPDNRVLCPQMETFFAFPYDDGLLAMGGRCLDGSYRALQTMFLSPDFGLTWRPAIGMDMPSELQGTQEPFAVTVDQDSYIWIVCGKQTWRGRLNRLGFEK